MSITVTTVAVAVYLEALALLALSTTVRVDSQVVSNVQSSDNNSDVLEAEKLIKEFMQYAAANNVTRFTFPNFNSGKFKEYNYSLNAYSASEVLHNTRNTVKAKCGDFVPESFSFLQCDFANRRALMRRRFALPAYDGNDCVINEIEVHVNNFSSNALLKHSGFDCDCNQGFLADTLQSLARQNIKVSSNPSSDGKRCVVSLTRAAPAPDSAERKIWYVLGCNYLTGSINLLPLFKNKSDPIKPQFQMLKSEICHCAPENIHLDGSCTSAGKEAIFYELGLCNYTTGKRQDKAYFFEFDKESKKYIRTEEQVQTPDSNCGSAIDLMKKFVSCELDQYAGAGLFVSYKAHCSQNGNTCVVQTATPTLPIGICSCWNGYFHTAAPQCPVIDRDISHGGTTGVYGPICVVGEDGWQRTLNKTHAAYYDYELRGKFERNHQALQRLIGNLFLEPLQSSCDCTTKVLRIPIGCRVVRKPELLYFMRFLVLTRRRGSFFCTVSQEYERLRVHPKYCPETS